MFGPPSSYPKAVVHATIARLRATLGLRRETRRNKPAGRVRNNDMPA